jgi:hypothetical protein
MAAAPVAVMYADGHLADGTWANRPIKGDAYHALHQIVSKAIKLKVPIIGAGDLIDKHRNTAQPITVFHKALDRLDAANLDFYFIQGQHEMDDVPWFSSHRAATHMRLFMKPKEFGPFKIWGIDYTPAGDLQRKLDEIPEGTDILVAHQVWSTFMGDIAAPQGGMHDVPVVNTVFTGDFHENKEVKAKGKDGQEIRVISPGSVCMQSISEPDEKFFYVLMDDGKFKKVPIDTRLMKDWSIIANQQGMDFFAANIEAELDALWESGLTLPEHIQKPLLRITYSHQVSDVRHRVMNLVGDRAHIFWKELAPEKPESVKRRAERVEGQKHATTLESKLAPYLKEQEQPRLIEPCQRLLQSNDVEAELRRMREEAFADE